MRPTILTLDLAALAQNLERVRAFAPNTKVMAMVKANAYGHGVLHVLPGLLKADALGVASIGEAVMLREAGVRQPIVLMEGLFNATELKEAEKHQLTLVVHQASQVTMLEKASVKRPFPVWLKINTGMHRLGIPCDSVTAFHARLQAATAVAKPIGLMTHFAKADSLHDPATLAQIDTFLHVTQGLPGPRSLGNSAGIVAWPVAHADWVRPGLLLYGASPFSDKTSLDYGLKPVMTLSSKLISIVDVKKGGQVGYGGTWTAARDTRVGIVAAGYGDGYPQSTANGTPVLVNGQQVPLVGRVSMDMLNVDLSGQPAASIGDEVILWGRGLPVEVVARASQSSAYELLTRMTARPSVIVENNISISDDCEQVTA